MKATAVSVRLRIYLCALKYNNRLDLRSLWPDLAAGRPDPASDGGSGAWMGSAGLLMGSPSLCMGFFCFFI